MHEIWMKQAIAVARASMHQGNGGPFGAVIVRAGKLIGQGANRVLSDCDPTAHGEMVAIRDACAKLGSYELAGAVIYTTGQPCPMCLGAIYWARLEAIYYGFSIDEAKHLGFDDARFFLELGKAPSLRCVPERAVCEQEALALAREYQQLPGRQLY